MAFYRYINLIYVSLNKTVTELADFAASCWVFLFLYEIRVH